MYSVSDLILTLSNLVVGSSLSYGIFPNTACPLRFSLDKRSFSKAEFSGTGEVSYTGEIILQANFNLALLMSPLRKWIQKRTKKLPELLLLQQMTFEDEDGELVPVFARPLSLEEEHFFANSLGRTYCILKKIKPKKKHIFWFVEEGKEGHPFERIPFLEVSSASEKAEKFLQKVESYQSDITPVQQFIGVVQALSSGRLVFQLQDDIRMLPELFRELIDLYPPYKDIFINSLIQDTQMNLSLSGSAEVKMLASYDVPDIRAGYQLLQPKTALQKVYYWFASQTEYKGPVLVLANRKTTLREYKEYFGSIGSEARGLLHYQNEGYCFVPKDHYKGFLRDLKHFVVINERLFPNLKKLRSAKVYQK